MPSSGTDQPGTGNLFGLSDEEILRAAGEVLQTRWQEAQALRISETRRLYRQYVAKQPARPHGLGKPVKLSQGEALLLFALERNKYEVEGHCSNGSRWHGSAHCKHHIRESAMCLMAQSRQDMLLGLWASVSEQESCENIVLLEEHLQGSVVQKHIRDLHKELRRQEREPDSLEEDE
jgi:hypothetical protein